MLEKGELEVLSGLNGQSKTVPFFYVDTSSSLSFRFWVAPENHARGEINEAVESSDWLL